MTQIAIEDTRMSQKQDSAKKYEPFRPILDRLLCRRLEDAEVGKIGVPDKFRQQTNKFEVLAVGDGVYIGGQFIRMPVEVGDKILAGEYNAEKFVKDGVELHIIRVQDVRGVERLICNE